MFDRNSVCDGSGGVSVRDYNINIGVLLLNGDKVDRVFTEGKTGLVLDE